jgi:hypothetical protein
MTAAEFYAVALPRIEALCALARTWRDAAPADPEAIAAHSEMTWLALRCDLRLNRHRVPASAGAPRKEA